MDKKKILIVEDNLQQLTVLSDAIAKAGFLVRRAMSGDEGLQVAVSSEPDLIITDKMMPKTSGLMMVSSIRDRPGWGKTVPIFVISNVGAGTDEERAMMDAIKPGEYLSKTELSLEQIVQKIKQVFDKTESKSGSAETDATTQQKLQP